jgi:TRAP-type uncharacterized transport system fused permease subunit
LRAWKVAKGLYLVPLLFAYTPFLSGDWPDMLRIFGFAVLGFWAVAAGIEGYWETRMNIVERLLTLGAGIVLVWPAPVTVNLSALAVFAVLFAWNIRKDRLKRQAETAT